MGKNENAEVIASGCGGDMTHCNAAFTDTDALLGARGGDAAAHWKNENAEVIASDGGGDMTHCYAAFTDTDALLGARGGDAAAHGKKIDTEVIASIPAFTATDAVVCERAGRDGSSSKNVCSEVSTGACGAHMTHCHDARGGCDPAHGKNGVGDDAAFIESKHSMGTPVSSRISDTPEKSASQSLNAPIEGLCDEKDPCFALLQTVSAVLEHVLRHDSGFILSEILSSCLAGNGEAIGSTKCVAASLNTALEHFLKRSALV